MAVSFCPQCGTKTPAGARFCPACGAALGAGGPAAGGAGPWRFSSAGTAVFGAFVVSGLALWVLILSPTPPRPGPGAGGPRGGPSAAAARPGVGELPEGHPEVNVPLPEEVKTFIADLAAKAREKPNDLEGWVRLGQVNSRAAQIDRSYSKDAQAAFRHVLERDPENVAALRGMASLHYDRNEHREAIPFYERYLKLRPDDDAARTDLGTMYMFAGDVTRARAMYGEVIRRNPSFLQAHYNLAIAHHREGDVAAALRELAVARDLADDEGMRKQIDDTMAALRGPAAPDAAATRDGPDAAAPAAQSSYQQAVETAFRDHPIMGPRIVGFTWASASAGRVMVRDFPMESMPPAVREKFSARLTEQLRAAGRDHGVGGPLRMEIADAGSGRVMATVTP